MKFYVTHFEKQNSCHNGFENPPMRDLFANKMAANKRDSPNNPNGNQSIFSSPVVCLCHGLVSVVDRAPCSRLCLCRA